MSTQEHAVARPARVEVLQAMARHPFLVLVTTLLFMAVGVGFGLGRTPNYTSRAIVAVGPITVKDPAAVPGIVTATQTLAEVYARTASATDVRNRALRALRRSGETLRGVRSSQIPDSPLIKIEADGRSSRGAVDAANAVSQALVAHVQAENSATDLGRIYARFRGAALAYVRQLDVVRRLTRAYGRQRSSAARRRRDDAQADLQADLLRRESLRTTYRDALSSSVATPGVRTFLRARTSRSDRNSLTQILGLIGLAAGLAVGAALATAQSNRRVSRLARP
jgi:hypothetical protein